MLQTRQPDPPAPGAPGEPRTWRTLPRQYQLADGQVWWPVLTEGGQPDGRFQGALYGRRSDGVNCFKMMIVSNPDDPAETAPAIEEATALVESMLHCPCTGTHQCKAHQVAPDGPITIGEGGQFPKA